MKKSWIFESVLEQLGDTQWAWIHTRAPLIVNNKPTILTSALIESLGQINGVVKVEAKRHRVDFEKSPAYTWEEILEKAVPVFVSYCPANY